MSPKEAIALSNGMIFFNSATKYVLSINEKHTKFPWRTQIDYNIAIIFNPMMLLGAYLGVIVNGILPDMIILIALFISIIAAGLISLQKGLKLYKEESKEIADKNASEQEK